jgi:hypothetical protein
VYVRKYLGRCFSCGTLTYMLLLKGG